MKPQRYGFLIGLNNPICKEKPPEKLSYAYVRNVQVQLRNLIQQNGFSSFQELKLL
ncbi:MAG: hypothetical protein ACPG0L_01525 [Bacteroidia bacterium]